MRLSYVLQLISSPLWQGFENAAIPGVDTITNQFSPNHPTWLQSKRMNGRFKIIRVVQTRMLRVEHEDAHSCAAMGKYRKCALAQGRDVARECGLPRAVQAAGGDNKAGINIGNGIAVDAGVRPRGSVWAPKNTVIAAADHDTNKLGTCVHT